MDNPYRASASAITTKAKLAGAWRAKAQADATGFSSKKPSPDAQTKAVGMAAMSNTTQQIGLLRAPNTRQFG
jgi:hypothetical protein